MKKRCATLKKSEIVQKAKKALRELKAYFEDQKKNGQPAPPWISAIAAMLMAGASIAAIWVAYRQLANLNKTLRMQNLTALLQIEKEIYERRGSMLDINHDLSG